MQPPKTVNPGQNIVPLRRSWATKIIERLHLLYGAKFLQQWADVDMEKLADAWAEELAGFTGEEIAAGLAACKSRPWPPTLPEFIGLCRPWLDPETAFREAVAGMAERNGGGMGKWSHPAIYWAAVRIGAHDLLNNGWQAMRSRWESALRDVMGQGRWADIPAPALKLAAPGGNIPTRAEAKAFLKSVKAGLPGSNLDAEGRIRDHKAWARRIMERGGGDTPTITAMAKRALEVTA